MKIRLQEVRPYTTKTGKQMYFIKTVEGQDLSTFDDMSQWKEGQELEGTITISEKLNKEGKPYKSFKRYNAETAEIFSRLDKLEKKVFGVEDIEDMPVDGVW